jgi:hypothetical protein
MHRIHSYDLVGAMFDILDKAAANGTTDFLALLSEAINTEDFCGYETIPTSVGFNWLRKDGNAERFAEFIDGDALDFYNGHLHNYYITNILHNLTLFSLIPETERAGFVRDVMDRHTTSGRWVRTVVEAGVPPADLAPIILDLLRSTEVNLTGSGTDFLSYEFLEYGAGHISRGLTGLHFAEHHTLWSVLTDEQFVEAIGICADKAPSLLFGGPNINSRITLIQKLDARLTRSQVDDLLEEAANKLPNLGGVSLDALARVPFDVRLALARRLDRPLELVVRLALELGEDDGGMAVYAEFIDSFAQVTAESYQQLYPLLRPPQKQEMDIVASVINIELVKVLVSSGFVIGTVVNDTFYNKRTGRTQQDLRVGWNGKTYVKDRSLHRPSPVKEGDLVIIDTKSGRHLKPRVIAVDFVLLRSAE